MKAVAKAETRPALERREMLDVKWRAHRLIFRVHRPRRKPKQARKDAAPRTSSSPSASPSSPQPARRHFEIAVEEIDWP
jgi:hypothetical protein